MPRFVAHEAKSMIGFHGLERVEPDMCKLGMHGLGKNFVAQNFRLNLFEFSRTAWSDRL